MRDAWRRESLRLVEAGLAIHGGCPPTISAVERVVGLFGTVGASHSETDEERLRRSLLVALALLISFLTVFWGLLYIVFGEPLGGAIPLTFTVLSLTSIVVLTLTRRYDVFRFTQLGLMLVLPFVLMIVLGGFIPSSVVAAWAFVAPLGALAFAGPREALRWLTFGPTSDRSLRPTIPPCRSTRSRSSS